VSTELLGARLLLAAVFLVAAIAKLADRPGTTAALAAFGVPERLTTFGAAALPLAELAVAAALLSDAGAEAGLLAAAALLTLFTGAMIATLARGQAPACNCFGSVGSRAIGRGTLIRNGVLLGIAILAAALGAGRAHPDAGSWTGSLSAAGLAAIIGGALVAAALALTWWFLLQVLRQNGRLLERVRVLEQAVGAVPTKGSPAPGGVLVGRPAPPLAGAVDLELGPVSLDDLLSRGRPVALVFTDPGCGPCNLMLPQLASLQRAHQGEVTIALLTRGDADTARAKHEEHGLGDVLLDGTGEVFSAYGAVATPSAVLVGIGGVVEAADVRGRTGVADLIRQAAADTFVSPLEVLEAGA
jgi:hypothetical protein